MSKAKVVTTGVVVPSVYDLPEGMTAAIGCPECSNLSLIIQQRMQKGEPWIMIECAECSFVLARGPAEQVLPQILFSSDETETVTN